MDFSTTRRRWFALPGLGLLRTPPLQASVPDSFPTQPPEVVREMVTVAHGNFKRVRELVDARPSLAKAGWDWGFGDWETALGAASHTGRREIAEYLMEHGARPTLFSAAMLGQLEVVKAFVAAQPGVQRIPGPHSIPLLAHARAGGPQAEPVLRYLESLGDAGAPAGPAISADRLEALTGTYVFGDGPKDRIEISVERGSLQLNRVGGDKRGLIPVGDMEFHPMGAAAVRVRFDGNGLKIYDPELVLTARR